MPELAEVEFFRKRWDQAAHGAKILRVHTHDAKRLFRTAPAPALRAALTGATFLSSEAAAKQMLFRFRTARKTDAWLGLHLGMSGELTVATADHAPRKHDHLILFSADHALVFSDPRMFGKIEFATGPAAPGWWTKIAPAVLSRDFTIPSVTTFLHRRARAPIKAVLLMQERWPGCGNWMADEILWRAAIHPARPAGSLTPAEIRTLWTECRKVARLALNVIAGRGKKLPPDLNHDIPDSWLFNHRWQKGGLCPITKKPLAHAEIGGRTTCWSPARQQLDP